MTRFYLFSIAVGFLGLALYFGYSFVNQACPPLMEKAGGCGLGSWSAAIAAGGAALIPVALLYYWKDRP